VVTRIHQLEGWWLTCEPFFHHNGMRASEIDDAKTEALERVTEKIVTCEREMKAHKQLLATEERE